MTLPAVICLTSLKPLNPNFKSSLRLNLCSYEYQRVRRGSVEGPQRVRALRLSLSLPLFFFFAIFFTQAPDVLDLNLCPPGVRAFLSLVFMLTCLSPSVCLLPLTYSLYVNGVFGFCLPCEVCVQSSCTLKVIQYTCSFETSVYSPMRVCVCLGRWRTQTGNPLLGVLLLAPGLLQPVSCFNTSQSHRLMERLPCRPHAVRQDITGSAPS